MVQEDIPRPNTMVSGTGILPLMPLHSSHAVSLLTCTLTCTHHNTLSLTHPPLSCPHPSTLAHSLSPPLTLTIALILTLSPHIPIPQGTRARWPTPGLQLSCPLWATSWAWGIVTERTSCLTQPMGTVSMLTSTACSIGYVCGVRAEGGPSRGALAQE